MKAVTLCKNVGKHDDNHNNSTRFFMPLVFATESVAKTDGTKRSDALATNGVFIKQTNTKNLQLSGGDKCPSKGEELVYGVKSLQHSTKSSEEIFPEFY